MKVIRCQYCKEAIPENADYCPICRTKLKKPKNKNGWGALIILVIVGTMISVFSNSNKPDTTSPKTQETTQEIEQITKKDGSVDQRKNDLDELCKDWVYFNAKIFKYSREGDERAAAKARNNFAAVNRDLSEYRDSDVSDTCAKYETREFIEPYMR